MDGYASSGGSASGASQSLAVAATEGSGRRDVILVVFCQHAPLFQTFKACLAQSDNLCMHSAFDAACHAFSILRSVSLAQSQHVCLYDLCRQDLKRQARRKPTTPKKGEMGVGNIKDLSRALHTYLSFNTSGSTRLPCKVTH
eukprot:2000459-Amphidinium_carterae.1